MNNKKDKLKIFIIISLILHIFVILIAFIFAVKKSFKKFPVQAELRPKKSEFGTTVLFDDRPQFTPAVSDVISDQIRITKQEHDQELQTTQKIKKESKENLKEKIKGEDKKIPDKVPEVKLATKQLTKDIKPIVSLENLEQERFIPEIKKDEQITTTQILGKHKIDQEGLHGQDKIDQKQIKADKMGSTDIIRQYGKDKKDASPAPASKKNLLKLTNGYLYNAKNEGNDWLYQNGKKNHMPDFKELAEISYRSKLQWYFQEESGINITNMSEKDKMHLIDGYKCKPAFFISIFHDGRLNEVKLVESSGAINYDTYLFITIQNMTLPPVPKHLCENGTNKYEIIIYVRNPYLDK
ncbi:MAG: hypothetical protein SZ59_C0002G0388 [candidate division TM6 bacterium GW2011_GWF2_28_16]|nr:MAG: hypothetical protein SZ59_C0002G0388 [candidate division TM6 bacterium GW2011_GWF2_28_16]